MLTQFVSISIVAQGKHLCGGQKDVSELKLKDSKTIGPNAIIVLTYVPA